MGDEFTASSRYAGDEAWTEWFDICSVPGCSEEHAAKLRAQIASAMYAQLARCGFSRADAGEDDPVAFFDSYFKLKGSREKPKPLKLYFRHRIAEEGLDLVDFTCGTLFGSGSGRIRDIVIDWISVLKGWKPRTVTDPDGRRHLAWENAGDADLAAVEQPCAPESVEFLDTDEYRRTAAELISALAKKIKAEKADVALLLYVTAHDIPMTEPCVLAALGVGKTQAYKMRDKTMTGLEKELRGNADAGSALFGRVLLEACVAELSERMKKELGAE